ncbi:hypothetical protein DS884_11030 [Tenacibaculum sp. E3R01]|uniref:DUF6705 family protein n=1 Tax=Tenacibaculum sp. E3R01 TaxID=2267227 RepID=UPI000DEA05B3|nr:DUF6705 family protein [Tenacibaculum sp. E3R01]RBW57579.1 hypothetical protein DS884_11030 [Tenacibaculum sp. E3R01]
MKIYIIIVLILITTISCKAQQVIPVENQIDYKDKEIEFPEGVYIKDVNNVLDKYIGVWKGTYNFKNYEFKVSKVTKQSNISTLKLDKLLIRYKITAANGLVLENTLNFPDYDIRIIEGRYLAKSGGYVLSYVENTDCGHGGDLYMSVYNSTNTKAVISLTSDGEYNFDKCPNGQTPPLLPTKDMQITKQ